MKVIKLSHPEQTYPDLLEGIFVKMGEYKLHSQCFLPGAIAGKGELLLFLEKKQSNCAAWDNVIKFERKRNE